MSRYTSATDADRQEMLEAIGASSIDELFDAVPEAVRLGRPLDLPPGKPEQEVYTRLRDLAARNVSTEDEISFLGAGMYDHYVPSLIDSILARSEFLTPYTPYQPEISQGGLQVMFEYQTAISELTGLPVSNASVYEGPSAFAAAAYLAKLHNKRTRFLVSAGVQPQSRETLVTTSAGWGTTVEEIAARRRRHRRGGAEGRDRRRRVGRARAVPELPRRRRGPAAAHRRRPRGRRADDRPVRPADPRRAQAARRVRRRRRRGGGADARQPARLRRPVVRLLRRHRRPTCAACRAASPARRATSTAAAASCSRCRRASSTSAARRRPTTSAPRRRSTRWRASIYLSWLGRRGLVELGELLLQRTAYARDAVAALDGVELLHEQPVVREFAVKLDAPVHAVIDRCAAEGINPGFPLEDDGLLIAITEQRSREDIDRLADVLGAAVAAEREAAHA